MSDLRSIARALGGEVAGINQVLAPAPGHSPLDRGLSILIDPRAPGGFLVHLFNGGDELAAKDWVRERLGLERVCRQLGDLRGGASRQVGHLNSTASDFDRTARSLALWNDGRAPRDTPVETYLARRGLTVRNDNAVLRWHPACPFAGRHTGVMLGLVRDVRSDCPVGIHRTALSLDGHRSEVEGKGRLALGPIAGGAVKLTPDEAVTTCIGIGEGIETTLSLCLASEFGSSPVWALLSAGGVERFPVLSGIEVLWIAVDHDPAGIRAARACAERWRAAGREVYLVSPTKAGADLNDIREARHVAG